MEADRESTFTPSFAAAAETAVLAASPAATLGCVETFRPGTKVPLAAVIPPLGSRLTTSSALKTGSERYRCAKRTVLPASSLVTRVVASWVLGEATPNTATY